MAIHKPTQGMVVRRTSLILLEVFSVFTFLSLGTFINGYGKHSSTFLNWVGTDVVKTDLLNSTFLGHLSIQSITVAYVISLIAAVLLGLYSFNITMKNQKKVDFLIDVETELRKVAWPIDMEAKNFMDKTRQLRSSSIVVFCVILFIAGLLFGYDLLFEKAFGLVFVNGS